MRSTYLSLQYHLVFSTKHRDSSISPEWQSGLHQYLGRIISGLEGIPIAIGGIPDHVHLLVGLRATHCLADVMRELKKISSLWVHNTLGIKTFAWQEGCAAFSVSATSAPGVRRYIENQEAHHRNQSSREELCTLFEKAGIEYNPMYLK